MPTFDVKNFFAGIVDERINTLISVPAIYWLAMNQPDFSRLDVSVYGGLAMAEHH